MVIVQPNSISFNAFQGKTIDWARKTGEGRRFVRDITWNQVEEAIKKNPKTKLSDETINEENMERPMPK